MVYFYGSISNFIPEISEYKDGVSPDRADTRELEDNFRNLGNDSAKVPSHITCIKGI